MLRSIVEYYAEHEGYKCGYCGSPNTNFSHGLWAHSMTVADYQDLIDRGWRRSGLYCYKPTMNVTCCPMYTIRCRALEFKASKSQKKILKCFNRFLSGEDMSKPYDRKMSTSSNCSEDMGQQGADQFVHSTIIPQEIDVNDVMNTECQLETSGEAESKSEVQSESAIENKRVDLKTPIKDSGPDPNKGPCKKAKQLRRERTLEKLKLKGINVDELPANNKNKEKELEDYLDELPIEFRNKLEIKLVRTNPPSAEYLATAAETHKVYVKYQTTIHNDKPEKCSEPKFRDFLVSSPLLEEHSADGPPSGYGSFHQQYWVDGRLIAVGVIDVLPKCVSSVYFFYDPQYMKLSLGTYGALREIAFTRQLHKECPNLRYYYMGYYIHSCRKMRYKGNYSPSDLVCPETYKWVPLKDTIPKLEACPYSRLDDDIHSIDENYPKESDINYIPCWVRGTVMPYKLYKRKIGKKVNDSEVIQYSQLVGAKTIKSMILVRPKIK